MRVDSEPVIQVIERETHAGVVSGNLEEPGQYGGALVAVMPSALILAQRQAQVILNPRKQGKAITRGDRCPEYLEQVVGQYQQLRPTHASEKRKIARAEAFCRDERGLQFYHFAMCRGPGGRRERL